MIHGINFGCRCADCSKADLPAAFKQRFTWRMRRLACGCPTSEYIGRTVTCEKHGSQKVVWFELKGVCTSEDESNYMFLTAKRPGREVVIEKRDTAGAPFYGIYCH